MSFVAVAIGTGVAGLAGAYYTGQAANRAADATRDAANSSSAVQREIFNQTREDQTPWREAGVSALDVLMGRDPNYRKRLDLTKRLEEAKSGASHLQGLLSQTNPNNPLNRPDPRWAPGLEQYNKDIENYTNQLREVGPERMLTPEEKTRAIMGDDPGYNFRMGEGTRAINASAAARGMGGSGATLKALMRYGQDYASNEYGNAYNRLSQIAGFGPAANAAVGNAGMNYANNVGANNMNAAGAYGAGQMAGASALNSAIGSGVNSYMNYQLMNRLFPQGK